MLIEKIVIQTAKVINIQTMITLINLKKRYVTVLYIFYSNICIFALSEYFHQNTIKKSQKKIVYYCYDFSRYRTHHYKLNKSILIDKVGHQIHQ